MNIDTARRFINKFGYNEITIDEFDSFLIDEGFSDDPGGEPTEQEQAGFLKRRADGRKKLDALGMKLQHDEAFKLVVLVRGEIYEIMRPEEGIRQEARDDAIKLPRSVENASRAAENRERFMTRQLRLAIKLHDQGKLSGERLTRITQAQKLTVEKRARMRQLAGGLLKITAEIEAEDLRLQKLTADPRNLIDGGLDEGAA